MDSFSHLKVYDYFNIILKLNFIAYIYRNFSKANKLSIKNHENI